MRYFICILTILFLSCNSQPENKYSKSHAKIFVKFDLNKNNNVVCDIYNSTEDTLVILVDPFYIEGNSTTSIHAWVWEKNVFSTPSILYFQKKDEKLNFDYDGEYKIFFKEFPELLVVNPYKKVIINLKLTNEFVELFEKNEYEFFGGIVYSRKIELDHAVKNIGDKIFDEYQKKLVYKSELAVKPITFETLEKLLRNTEEGKSKITILIWENFIYKASSDNYN